MYDYCVCVCVCVCGGGGGGVVVWERLECVWEEWERA